ncbi:MAG: hypothetical protein Q9173_006178 [Seirophora scorigena]
MDPTSNTHPGSPALTQTLRLTSPPGTVPPYEPNPAYTQQPHMQHQGSYNNALIQPHHQQQQYPEQQQYPQQPMASPPMDPPKQEYYSAQPHPMQQQQPVQQTGYQTAIPLANLEDVAAPADCPRCQMRALTVVESHSGRTTQ